MTCRVWQSLASRAVYAPWVRSSVVQAQYFKDPHRLEAYLQHNTFLPDINNELRAKNSQVGAGRKTASAPAGAPAGACSRLPLPASGPCASC
jgi:hypothetical protein